MTHLVPSLAAMVHQADALHQAGQLPRARRAWEELVQRAQDRADRRIESVARSMLARCLLGLRDLEGARDQLAAAARIVDPGDTETHARYRGALARVAIEDGPPDVARQELGAYLRWAEDSGLAGPVVDACLLAVHLLPPPDRAEWLERGLERVQALGEPVTAAQARVASELGTALDQLGHGERALAAYRQALGWLRRVPDAADRDRVATGWAAGAVACRLEDWPLAREVLEEAVARGEGADDCDDLVALALADLATVYEAAGDVVEARRLVLRAVALGREQQLGAAWPERWARLLDDARRLELDGV